MATRGGREWRAGSPCTKCDGWDAACRRGAQPNRQRHPEERALRNVSGQSELFQSLVLEARRELSSPEAKSGKSNRFPRLHSFTGNFHPNPEQSASRGSRARFSSGSCSPPPSPSIIFVLLFPPAASDNVTFCQSAGEHAAVAAGPTVAATEIDSNKCRERKSRVRTRGGRGRGAKGSR